jgi:excisionase family DNA binding protein
MPAKQNQNPVARRFLTIRETAELLREHEVTIRRHVALGLIPSVRLPGRGPRRPVRIDITALEATLAKSATPQR